MNSIIDQQNELVLIPGPEIKFQAWDESKKVMHKDFQFIRSGIEGNDWIVFISDRQTLAEEPHPFKNPYFQQQMKIRPYTNIKDVDGEELYAGDIVFLSFDIITMVGYIKQAEDGTWLIYKDEGNKLGLHHNRDRITKIGNIYENSEKLDVSTRMLLGI